MAETKWFQVQDDYDSRLSLRKKIVNGVKYIQHGKHHVVHKPGPRPPPPETAAYDHGREPEVQQAQ